MRVHQGGSEARAPGVEHEGSDEDDWDEDPGGAGDHGAEDGEASLQVQEAV